MGHANDTKPHSHPTPHLTGSGTGAGTGTRDHGGPITAAGSDGIETGRSFAIFAFLWAIGVLYHQSHWNTWMIGPAQLLLSAAALWVLLKPSSILRFGAMMAFHALSVGDEMPWVSNHWIFTGLAVLPPLWALAKHAWHTAITGKPIDKTAFFKEFAPVIRLSLLLLYFFTIFHKLNLGFFDPELSCGGALYYRLTDRFTFLPTEPWTIVVSAIATHVVEGTMALMLLFPKSRKPGVVLAAAFHAMLGTIGYANFSALVFAILFLFTPINFPTYLLTIWRNTGIPNLRFSAGIARVWSRVDRALSTLLVGLCIAGFLWAPWKEPGPVQFMRGWDFDFTLLQYLFRKSWYLYGLLYLGILAYTLWRYRDSLVTAPNALRIRKFSAFFVLALIVVNGFAPYVGLKTENSYSMFSNLRTEGENNHFLLAGLPQIFGYQQDQVELIETNDPQLQKVIDKGHQIVWFELRSYLARRAAHDQLELSLTYRRDGAEYRIDGIDPEAQYAQPDDFIERKILYFRTIRYGDTNHCGH